jgi:class 3 adenylate cyclase
MAEERTQRRLAAILAADVVGYSRLMEQDEAGTLAAIRDLRREVIDPFLSEHHGRIVKLMGDGALALPTDRSQHRQAHRGAVATARLSGLSARPSRRRNTGSAG